MYISMIVNEVITKARDLATSCHHEYLMPEHVLIAMCQIPEFKEPFESCGGDAANLEKELRDYLNENLMESTKEPIESFGLQQVFIWASEQVINSGKDEIYLHHLFMGMMHLPESYCTYFINKQGIEISDLLYEMCHEEENQDARPIEESAEVEENPKEVAKKSELNYLTNLNEQVKEGQEPLIGREDIMRRTIQILCRKQKNNPIHVGDPGVGKTAIALGLAVKINEGNVPKELQNAEIFELDLGAALAGTQYRGDFEKKIKKGLDQLKTKTKPIVYIDEIHNIVGAGALGNGSLDASNLLKPYLNQGHIRFMGATTHEEYRKYLEKDKGLIRRFQTIEVKEPSIEEAIQILKGIKAHFESFHQVTYTEEAIEAAVKLSKQYINDRFLPDKAIDLLDEAGAYLKMENQEETSKKNKTVTASIIEATLAHICHIPKKEVQKDEKQVLKNLENKLKKQVFGQDEAVEEITRSIKLSRAGLSDDNKPVASLLFVGPTGVGKTELAKVLASELGIKLIRFDMSEYTEKHTASKLIGSPPGYIGYEEGGLLTDEIRKNPYCILLLDEIEKAHQDIYNILLQVMDYATLTDNQGKKADFRNVILIMTSNAGAAKVGSKLMGFGERVVEESMIQEAVKKTFSPEFRNRLTKIITFKHINKEMGLKIIRKQLKAFKDQLLLKNIQISFSKKVESFILEKGVSAEYGAREINRIVEGEMKPILVDEILFGHLSKGGSCKIDVKDNKFIVEIKE